MAINSRTHQKRETCRYHLHVPAVGLCFCTQGTRAMKKVASLFPSQYLLSVPNIYQRHKLLMSYYSSIFCFVIIIIFFMDFMRTCLPHVTFTPAVDPTDLPHYAQKAGTPTPLKNSLLLPDIPSTPLTLILNFGTE